MADENRNQEKKTQRANEQGWSNDPTHIPGQQAGDPNPSDKQYDKTEPMQRTNRDPGTRTRPEEYYAGGTGGGSQTPNQGSRPGNPNRQSGVDDDDATIREPNTGDDDEARRGGLGGDRGTDDQSRRGGMGGGSGTGRPGEEDR